MVRRDELQQYLTQLLSPEQFKDYAPNGLQVEGVDEINTLVSGVTASQALIDKAIALRADAVFVHHGYFWRGEAQQITGMKYRRIKALMSHNINLFAYHLPLDAHPELGNNAQLAQRLGIVVDGGLDQESAFSIGNVGHLPQPVTLSAFANTVTEALGRAPLVIEGGDHLIHKVAWCTGGAQGFIEKAVAAGADAYLSGEISEPTTHIAREHGIHYLAAGHHATERYGAAAVGAHLAEKFELNHHFADIDNPA